VSPNGDAPDMSDPIEVRTKMWGHLCTITAQLDALRCKEHGATIDANQAAVAKLEAQGAAAATQQKAETARWKLALDYGWKVAVLILTLYFGGKEVKQQLSGAPPAPPAPHVTTVIQP